MNINEESHAVNVYESVLRTVFPAAPVLTLLAMAWHFAIVYSTDLDDAFREPMIRISFAISVVSVAATVCIWLSLRGSTAPKANAGMVATIFMAALACLSFLLLFGAMLYR